MQKCAMANTIHSEFEEFLSVVDILWDFSQMNSDAESVIFPGHVGNRKQVRRFVFWVTTDVDTNDHIGSCKWR